MNDNDELDEQLLSLERGFWDAAGDGGFYERNMAADGRCLLPVGLLDRAATVEAIDQAAPWSSYDFDDVAVHEFGSDGAVVSYRATADRDGGEPTYRALVATAYRRDGDRWKLVVHQQAPLPDEG